MILFNSKYIIAISLFAMILFISGVPISIADSPPPLPNTFSGTIKFINSSGQFDAPEGTIIEASIDNVIKGTSTVTTPGIYMINITGTSDDDGKVIMFKANHVRAEQTALFNATLPDPKKIDLTINLSRPLVPFPGLNKLPTDPDNDGIYEDLNGNGRKDFNDVVLFFNNLEWIQDNEPIYGFDLNGNMRIDFADIVRLFEEV